MPLCIAAFSKCFGVEQVNNSSACPHPAQLVSAAVGVLTASLMNLANFNPSGAGLDGLGSSI
jgi:hypothetical protein